MTSVMPAGTARGSLLQDPPLRIASLDAATFGTELGTSASGVQLLEVAGQPSCGVDFYYLQYNTVVGKGEATTASGALMVPTGSAPQCSGGRPIVLYAHGTDTDRNLNIADITNTSNTEGALIARCSQPGLHRGGAELRGLRHLDAGLSPLLECGSAIQGHD